MAQTAGSNRAERQRYAAAARDGRHPTDLRWPPGRQGADEEKRHETSECEVRYGNAE